MRKAAYPLRSSFESLGMRVEKLPWRIADEVEGSWSSDTLLRPPMSLSHPRTVF